MPSGSYWQADVQCPFYKEDDGVFNITCEGFGNARFLKQGYRLKADFINQISVFCCEHYKKCEVYRLLMEKYEEDN